MRLAKHLCPVGRQHTAERLFKSAYNTQKPACICAAGLLQYRVSALLLIVIYREGRAQACLQAIDFTNKNGFRAGAGMTGLLITRSELKYKTDLRTP
jgi:hypothetical protein